MKSIGHPVPEIWPFEIFQDAATKLDAINVVVCMLSLCYVEGCCYLKPTDVLTLLRDILFDEWKCEMYGAELTTVILKDVLSIRTSWFSLSAFICQGKSISGLLETFLTFVINSKCNSVTAKPGMMNVVSLWV